MNWTQATPYAGWSNRLDHSSVVFDNKIWVIGGRDSALNYKNDVWYSSDSTNWMMATASAQWSARRYAASVVSDNKNWIIGGGTASNFYNDV